MSPFRVARWVITVVLSALLFSCAKEEAGTKIAIDSRPLDSPAPALEDSMIPANGERADYARACERLEALIERGRREIRSMGELPRQAAADAGLYAAQMGILEDTRCEWSDDLVLIEGNLPEEPAGAVDTPLSLVHANLSRAVQELRQVRFTAPSGGTAAVQDREKRLDAAEQSLRRARQHLEGAPR